jgi:hypothetical protein
MNPDRSLASGYKDTANGRVAFDMNNGPLVITTKYKIYNITASNFWIITPNWCDKYWVDIRRLIIISGYGVFTRLRDRDVTA